MSIQCQECGSPTERSVHNRAKRFCSEKCQKTWFNRRAIRGAMLYDFMMTMRYDRDNADQARDNLQNLCRAFRDSDKALREGRRSWKDYPEAAASVPNAFGQMGDGR